MSIHALTSLYVDLSSVTKDNLKFVTNNVPGIPCLISEKEFNLETRAALAIIFSPENKT